MNIASRTICEDAVRNILIVTLEQSSLKVNQRYSSGIVVSRSSCASGRWYSSIKPWLVVLPCRHTGHLVSISVDGAIVAVRS